MANYLAQISDQGEIRLFGQVDELKHHKTWFFYLRYHRHSMTVCLAGDGANHPIPHSRQDTGFSPTTTTAAETESGRGDATCLSSVEWN